MRQRRFDFIVTIVSMALLGYFAWHGWKGPRGFAYRDRLEAQVAQLEDRYAQADAARQHLEHRVSLMRPDSIDPDMLDELARDELEMTGPSDVVAFQDGRNSQPNP